nr:MAG TPA: hypothetical protein [Caudoviricetes sp.]
MQQVQKRAGRAWQVSLSGVQKAVLSRVPRS